MKLHVVMSALLVSCFTYHGMYGTGTSYANSQKDKCVVCKKENDLKRCRGCRVVLYCSQACQKTDWPQHKIDCLAIQQAFQKAFFGENVFSILSTHQLNRQFCQTLNYKLDFDESLLQINLKAQKFSDLLEHLYKVKDQKSVVEWLKKNGWGYSPLMLFYVHSALENNNYDCDTVLMWLQGAFIYYELEMACVESSNKGLMNLKNAFGQNFYQLRCSSKLPSGEVLNQL